MNMPKSSVNDYLRRRNGNTVLGAAKAGCIPGEMIGTPNAPIPKKIKVKEEDGALWRSARIRGARVRAVLMIWRVMSRSGSPTILHFIKAQRRSGFRQLQGFSRRRV
jgi:hypothetical protein